MAVRREDLARRRRLLGLSQDELAARLRVDRSTVARWERGDTEPQPWMRTGLCKVLHLDLQQLDRLLRGANQGEAGFTSASPAEIESAKSPISPQGSAIYPIGAYSKSWTALPFAGAIGIGVESSLPGESKFRERTLIMSAAEESAAFGYRISQSNLEPSGLDQIEVEIARIASAYLTQPLVPLIAEMRLVRNMVFAILEGRQYPAQSRQMYGYAAQLCGLLASASSDLAYYDAAQTHARTALLSVRHLEVAGQVSGVTVFQDAHAGRARVSVV
jgi:transcriptional regulator with XRE-family HTH domain